MKNTIYLIAGIILVISISFAPKTQAGIYYTISDSLITPGEQFDVAVYSSGELGDGDLTKFGFAYYSVKLDFIDPPPDVFRIVGHTLGDQFSEWNPLPHLEPEGGFYDNFIGGILQDGFHNAGEDVLLGSIIVEALTEGIGGFFIDGPVRSAYYKGLTGEAGLYYQNTYETIEHSVRFDVAPAPVPEPATMLLFGTGLVGLVCSRLRKKKK